MISDEKRRQAVAELHEASTGAYRHVDALDVIAGAVGVEVDGKSGHEVENETYATLADFIDRPTCFDTENKDSPLFICSECGSIESKFTVDPFISSYFYIKPSYRYCPNCGAYRRRHDSKGAGRG